MPRATCTATNDMSQIDALDSAAVATLVEAWRALNRGADGS